MSTLRFFTPLLFAFALLATTWAHAQGYPIHVGGPSADVANEVDYDDAGNAYVVGNYQGTADFDPGAGTLLLASAGNTDAYVAIYDPIGMPLFAWRLGGPGADTANDVRVRNGIIFVTGSYAAGANFLGTFPPSGGGIDAYVAAFDVSSGTPTLLWLSPITGPGAQIGEDLDVDPFAPANVWATGSFAGTTNFATGFFLTSAGNTDVFLAAYAAPSGAFYDAFRVGGPGPDAGLGISLLRPSLPCVTGRFRNTVDFDPTTAVFNLVSAGNDDGFAACYLDPTPGSPTFFPPFNAFRIGGPSVDRGYDIDTGFSSGALAVHLTGGFSATASFNGVNRTSNGQLDAFVATYDVNANPLWVVPVGRTQNDAGLGIEADDCGNVVATGTFRAGPVDFDPFVGGPSYTLPTYNNYDAWVAGYNTAGGFRFANRIARNGPDLGYGVAVKPSGAHFAAGQFAQAPVFSSGTIVSAITPFASYGGTDGYLSAYNVNGALRRPSCIAPPAGLEVWIDGDTFSGGLYQDLTASYTVPNNGTPVGGTVLGPGAVDQGLYFPAPPDLVAIPPDPSLAPGPNDLTVDAWVQHDATIVSNHLSVVSNIGTPNVGGYEVLLRRATPTDWTINVIVDDPGGPPPVVLTSPPFPFPPNTWHFIAATVDHTTTASFYVDGLFIGAAAGPPVGPITHQGPMFLHQSSFAGGGDQPGALDEVEVFHTLLNATDINRIYLYGKCKPCWTAPYQPTFRTAGNATDEDDPFAPAPGVEAQSETPMAFALAPAAPNPTAGLAEIAFSLPAAADTRLVVYDVLGREVAVVVDERREAGLHVARFDAGSLPAGVYLYRLEAGSQTATRRLTVAR